MARRERKYKRMPGRPFSPFEVRSLWQGPDHLLWVEAVFFKEHYKRFFYADIQSVILRQTDIHMAWSFVWGALALICGLIAFLVPGTPYISTAFTTIFLLALAINFALGASCTVYLQTAAQVQKISSLKRVRTAQKTATRIKELVEAVQGPWKDQSGLIVKDAETQASPVRGSSVNTPIGLQNQSMAADLDKPFNPAMHQVLFGLLLTLGILGGIQILIKSLPLAVFETLLHGATQIMVLVALVRSYRVLKGTLVSKVNWLALVFVVTQTIIGYGLILAVSFSNPQINYHHWAMFKKLFDLQWTDHPLALAGNLVYAAGSLLLGIFGLLVLRRHKTGTK